MEKLGSEFLKEGETPGFEFLKEAFERQGRLINTMALLQGYHDEANAELGDMASRSARPLEFLYLMAGETDSPGSVTAADIHRAIQLGRELDAKAPPKDNLPMDGTRPPPLADLVQTYSTERLQRELKQREQFKKWTLTDDYAAGANSEGATAADVLADRAQAVEEVRIVRAELEKRAPLVNNVRSLGKSV